MSVLRLHRLGDPILRSRAQAVDPARLEEPELQRLVDDMIETMKAASGVGLAAPQVGEGLQLFVYQTGFPDDSAKAKGAEEESSDEAGKLIRVLVNPSVEPEPGEAVYDWEGCLSIPDLRGLVPRHPAVRVRGLDRHGKAVSYVAQGFEARIIQHEYDHLNGVVFLDRMRDLRSLAFEEEWQKYLAHSPDQDDEQAAVG